MSNMTIAVEFMAGTSVIQAVQEAKEKAIKWDVAYITFKFNGVGFSISQKANVELCHELFMAAYDKEFKYVCN